MGGPSGARLIRRGNEQLSFGVGAPKERSVRGSTGKERYVSDSTIGRGTWEVRQGLD